jgi:hypothetical protein
MEWAGGRSEETLPNGGTRATQDDGRSAAEKAAIQLVKVQSRQLLVAGVCGCHIPGAGNQLF